jgi:putative phage-type endonuclease
MEIKNRKKIEVEQGSGEWLEIRKSWVGGASEAPAALGVSKYKSRQDFIEERLGFGKEITDFQKSLFNKGHESEEKARSVLEIERMEDFAPAIFQVEIEGIVFGASLDGLSEDGKTIFEHKLYNKDLAANLKRGLIDPHYSTQLDQQLLCSGAEEVLFITSDGTDQLREIFTYKTTDEKLRALVDGWKQFEEDKKNYKIEPKAEKVEPTKTDQFPIVDFEVDGVSIISNIDEYKPAIEEISKHVFELINKEDKTDLDFSNLDHYAKAGEKERKALKSHLEEVKRVFEAYAKFESNIKDCDSIIQKFSAAAKKTSKEAKEEIKNSIALSFNKDLIDYSKVLNEEISFEIETVSYNLKEFGKGKKTIESYKSVLSDEVARIKVGIKKHFELIKIFDSYISEKSDYLFLFSDREILIDENLSNFEKFKSIVNQRIEDHKKRETEKVEQAKRDEEERLKREAEELELFRKASSATIHQNNNKEEVVFSEMEIATSAVSKKENTEIQNIVTFHGDSLEIYIEDRKYSCEIYSGLEKYEILHRLKDFIEHLYFNEG